MHWMHGPSEGIRQRTDHKLHNPENKSLFFGVKAAFGQFFPQMPARCSCNLAAMKNTRKKTFETNHPTVKRPSLVKYSPLQRNPPREPEKHCFYNRLLQGQAAVSCRRKGKREFQRMADAPSEQNAPPGNLNPPAFEWEDDPENNKQPA